MAKMDEYVRDQIKHIVLTAIEDCAREYYDEPTPEEEATAAVQQIVSLVTESIDVAELERLMGEHLYNDEEFGVMGMNEAAVAIAARLSKPLDMAKLDSILEKQMYDKEINS